MILSHCIIETDERVEVKAELTTQHPLSSYGQPVLVLEDGTVVDLFSWMTLGYKVEKATQEELSAFSRIVNYPLLK